MKRSVLTIALTVAAASASAQFYAGAAGGMGKINNVCQGAYSCDDKNFGYKLYLGYQDNATTAVELSHVHFGKAELTSGANKIEGKVKALALALAFRNQYGQRLNSVARIGIADVKTDVTSNIGYTDEGSNTSLYLGAGLEYAFMPKLKATANWDMTRATTDGGERGFLHLFTVGAQYTY